MSVGKKTNGKLFWSYLLLTSSLENEFKSARWAYIKQMLEISRFSIISWCCWLTWRAYWSWSGLHRWEPQTDACSLNRKFTFRFQRWFQVIWKGSRKYSYFLSGPVTKALPPPSSSSVAPFFSGIFLELQKVLFS